METGSRKAKRGGEDKKEGKYIVEILKMKDRWPTVCLREENRRIINRNPSQWGREFKQALEEVGDVQKSMQYGKSWNGGKY